MTYRNIALYLWIIALVLGVRAYCLVNPEPVRPEPYGSLYQEVLSPVVKVTTPQGRGSGVIISAEAGRIRILTAAHVVGDASTVTVYIYEYQYKVPIVTIKSASVVMTDTAKDLALLRITNYRLWSRIYPARLTSRDYTPHLFTEVYAVGCSLGSKPRPSSGIFSASGMHSWEVSAPVLPGNSGGGIFLKDTHELIGITVWVRTYHGQLITTMAGIVPINQVYEFLDKTPLMNCEEHKSEGKPVSQAGVPSAQSEQGGPDG